jgi:Mu-like prophage protein gp45
MDRETAHQIRGLVSRAVFTGTSDAGGTQTTSVTLAGGNTLTDVEVMQPFGFASHPPAGGLGIAFAVGGDQGDVALFPASHPGHRLGNMPEGESAIYSIDGSRVHAKADGEIESTATRKIFMHVGDKIIEVDLEADVLHVQYGTGASAPRLTVRPNYVKMRAGDNAVIVKPDGIFSTVPIVVGPDPEPGI